MGMSGKRSWLPGPSIGISLSYDSALGPRVPLQDEFHLITWLAPFHSFTSLPHQQCFLSSLSNKLLALELFRGLVLEKIKARGSGGIWLYAVSLGCGLLQTHRANLGRIRTPRPSPDPSYSIKRNTFSSFLECYTVITVFKRENSIIQVGSVS